jgi:Lrp/AsnC family leucine-responsive transcriptional regulator
MIKVSQQPVLDEVDKAMLRLLQNDGGLSNVQVARAVKLSPPGAHARLRRLRKEGYIRKTAVILDREKAGYDLLGFIQISLQMHQWEQVEKFRKLIRQWPEVLECHHITGEYDYLLKVVLHNQKDLERFVVDRLTPIPGVARIHTSLVLNEVKSTTALPLG